MTRRPLLDLASLTSEAAAPMAEGVQRTAKPIAVLAPVAPEAKKGRAGKTPTANLEALAFKVPPAFRKRFRQRAANADLKLNELLFAALDAWEAKQGLK